MNKYFKNFDGDYIFSVGTGTGDAEITKEEYETILSVIKNRPKAESGFDNKLRKDMTWELVELPPEPEYDPEATEADYLEALAELGVTLDEEI